jgi:hypothetical protein
MKSKFCCLALVISAAVAAPVQGDDHHGGRNVAVASRGSARSSAASVRSMPRGNFGGRPIVAGQRFSAIGVRSPQTVFRHSNVSASGGASIGQRFPSRTFNGGDRLTRFSNSEARPARFENLNRDRFAQFTRRPLNRTEGLTRFSNSEARPARFENRNSDRFAQIGNRNRGLSAGREHIFARRSANWQPNWDRHRDHWWNGHCCRFVNGVWAIFDFGFYPWWSYSYPYGYGYPYSYPYDYYPSYYSYDSSYGYDPGGYDRGAYDQNDADYYGRGAYNSPDQYTDRTVVAVQTQLTKEGYYRGEIDGILGPETRRAIVSFQSDHGLRVTGNLSQETLSTLGL